MQGSRCSAGSATAQLNYKCKSWSNSESEHKVEDWSTAQKLAATPANSEERFQARRLLPGMAKRLREARQRSYSSVIICFPKLACSSALLSVLTHQLCRKPVHSYSIVSRSLWDKGCSADN